jgi:hypothetical protein
LKEPFEKNIYCKMSEISVTIETSETMDTRDTTNSREREDK